jgi:hypothetical protein
VLPLKKCLNILTFKRSLRKLSGYDEWSSLKIHVAMDNAVVIEEIG